MSTPSQLGRDPRFTPPGAPALEVRPGVQNRYPDVLTAEALAALSALTGLNARRIALMQERIQRRAARASAK